MTNPTLIEKLGAWVRQARCNHTDVVTVHEAWVDATGNPCVRSSAECQKCGKGVPPTPLPDDNMMRLMEEAKCRAAALKARAEG